jgi:glycosyltransferase involved in cell wall biosynthesis
LVFVTRHNRQVFERLPGNVELIPVHINNHSRILRVLYEQFILPFRIRALKAEVGFFPLNMMPLLFGIGAPAVVTIHDASPALYLDKLRHYASSLRMRLVYWLEKKSASRASRVITVSYFAAKEVSRFTSIREHEIIVIFPGLSELSGEFEGAKDLRPAAPYILLVGRIHKHKNFDGFVRAFAEAHRTYGLPHNVLIAGPGGSGLPDLQRAIAATGTESRVSVLGAIGARELALLYSNASLFVLSSTYEGFGFPLLEALEFGLPCITTDCCSLSEVGADAVHYVRPDDHADMVAALGNLLTDQNACQLLSERARLRAKQFSWQISARKLLSIFESVVNAKNG